MVFGVLATFFTIMVYALFLASMHWQKPTNEDQASFAFNMTEKSHETDSVCSTDWDAHGIAITAKSEAYIDAKIAVYSQKKQLGAHFRKGNITMDSVKKVFSEYLLNKILPYWYGTEWSFEGHTAIPNKGQIACGYFISTTLKDMGLSLNRYRLAQQGPLDEAMTISCGAPVTTIEAKNTAEAINTIDNLIVEGIYFIGFDEGHVGYLLKRKSRLYLIHSNYYYPGRVEIECLQKSKVFQSFSKFHIVAVSTNEYLLRHWLNSLPLTQ